MKKKLLSVLALCLTVGMLAGCGANEDSTVLKDMKVEKYVTLGVYKGLEVSVPAPTVDEEELEYYVNGMYQQSITEEYGIKDRAVAEGDTANIDYVGKKDGVAFDGGTAAGQNLEIGSGTFIDGFEEGLVGVMPGETVDLNLTFPENYHSADLAGQAVVFTVTVNYILPTEMEDAVVAGMGIEGVSNVEQFEQYIYDNLYESAEAAYETSVENAVLEAFVANNTYKETPEALVEKYEQNARINIEVAAVSYEMDVESFISYYYGMDYDTFVDEYCVEAANRSMAMQAVANAENLNVSDEELDTKLLEQAQASGYDTIEEFLGEISKEEYREYFLQEKVLDYLVENAVISE